MCAITIYYPVQCHMYHIYIYIYISYFDKFHINRKNARFFFWCARQILARIEISGMGSFLWWIALCIGFLFFICTPCFPFIYFFCLYNSSDFCKRSQTKIANPFRSIVVVPHSSFEVLILRLSFVLSFSTVLTYVISFQLCSEFTLNLPTNKSHTPASLCCCCCFQCVYSCQRTPFFLFAHLNEIIPYREHSNEMNTKIRRFCHFI